MYIVGCVCVGVNKIGTVLGVNLVIGLSDVYNWLCVLVLIRLALGWG